LCDAFEPPPRTFVNHQRAAELHDGAAHAHRVAEQQGKQDHLTGHEHHHKHVSRDAVIQTL
jgi:hypothetical protein